ncbi:MAG: biotin--[acetyl-CoA-carboxylase] ligase [Verrucomicrobia bacterium]|jgi:BirA family biotin operon repressor/biotin-[acetyl-CoA-carboxylase] ligase|nr:biotin--[acetyl-CoA-carboxylase] ligase [Verrucomicrobiota bacterium]|tara:strand:- start:5830 stop:6576 length:747 start_codon:yes stop_codon:yes gene_type:complete
MNGFAEAAALMPDPFRILWKEDIGSTNDELRALAEKGTAEGLVLIAENQTAGRGRRGAEWFSPAGEGLAFSVLLKPTASKDFWSRLSLATGLAVAEAVEKFVPLAEIKWPNDVLVNGRKIAGILVEAGKDFVIVGIGININSMDFPGELTATSLAIESGQEVERPAVLLEVVKRLSIHADRIDQSFENTMDGVRQRCWLTGKLVRFTCSGVGKTGLVKGLGSGGELLVEIGGKLERIVQADEVRILSE